MPNTESSENGPSSDTRVSLDDHGAFPGGESDPDFGGLGGSSPESAATAGGLVGKASHEAQHGVGDPTLGQQQDEMLPERLFAAGRYIEAMKIWQAALKLEGLPGDDRPALQFNILVGELAIIANGKSDMARLVKMIKRVGMDFVESGCKDRGFPEVADFCRTVIENSE